MAIDGVGILESDLAHDIYSEFMDLYDSNMSVVDIRNRMDSWRSELADDLEREIHLSTCCQALWEIGELKGSDRQLLLSMIESEKGLCLWRVMGEELYATRKKVLRRQLSRLSNPKPKSRPRKKYRKVDRLLFSVGDCLVYHHSNGDSYPLLVCDVSQDRGECLYSMVPVVVVDSSRAVACEHVANGHFVGRKIPSSFAALGFTYGFSVTRPEHRELIKYADDFSKVGRVEIRTDNAGIGSFGGIRTREDFEDDVVRILRDRAAFGDSLLPVKAVIRSEE